MSRAARVLRRITRSPLIPERLLTWRQGRALSELCMAYGGRFSDGETRVCGNRRGHLDSHCYDRIDDILRPRGWCERDGVLVQVRKSVPEPDLVERLYDPRLHGWR